jgi:hypothetical protein
MKSILFKNETTLPVLVGTWMSTGINGLSEFIEIKVNGTEEIILYDSLTGEWIINSLFCINTPEYQIWKEQGYKQIEYIGKFRSKSCFSGNNTWIDTQQFTLNYFKNEKSIPNVILSFN